MTTRKKGDIAKRLQADLAKKRKARRDALPKLKDGQRRVARGRLVATLAGPVAFPGGVSASDLPGGQRAFEALERANTFEH